MFVEIEAGLSVHPAPRFGEKLSLIRLDTVLSERIHLRQALSGASMRTQHMLGQ